MTKRPAAAAAGKDNPKGTAMTTLRHRPRSTASHPSVRRRAGAGAPVGAARFPNDWISATLRLGPDRRLVRVSADGIEWVLAAEDFDALARAAAGAPVRVEWNPDLGRVLIPGAHSRAGTSFFRLATGRS
jgi:hypothetical protein